jgi:hypothetical protein
MSTFLRLRIDRIRPLLEHMSTLYGMLGLVVHRPRRSPILSDFSIQSPLKPASLSSVEPVRDSCGVGRPATPSLT